MPFKISRTSIVRLRPPCLAGGIMGSTIAHHDEGGRGSEKIPLRSSCSRAVSHTKCATWSSISQMAWAACVRCGELSGAKVISSSVSEMRMSPAVANSSCAGVWADQAGAWLPSVPDARHREDAHRMGDRLHGPQPAEVGPGVCLRQG